MYVHFKMAYSIYIIQKDKIIGFIKISDIFFELKIVKKIDY